MDAWSVNAESLAVLAITLIMAGFTVLILDAMLED
jgi:hypothetical protein